MKKGLFLWLLISLLSLTLIPINVFSKGRSGGGYYSGGHGSSHKGGHYVRPSTGNHYGSRSSYRSSTRSYHSGRHSRGYSSNRRSYSHRAKSHPRYSSSLSFHGSVSRNGRGRIVRSESAKESFLKSHGYKNVPHGYQVDHILPLYAGGSDTPSNMQLISTEQHKAKTKSDYKMYGR